MRPWPHRDAASCVLQVSPLNPNPVGERLLTIGVFLLGAFVYAAFYGNIGQFIESMYASGRRLDVARAARASAPPQKTLLKGWRPAEITSKHRGETSKHPWGNNSLHFLLYTSASW